MLYDKNPMIWSKSEDRIVIDFDGEMFIVKSNDVLLVLFDEFAGTKLAGTAKIEVITFQELYDNILDGVGDSYRFIGRFRDMCGIGYYK